MQHRDKSRIRSVLSNRRLSRMLMLVPLSFVAVAALAAAVATSDNQSGTMAYSSTSSENGQCPNNDTSNNNCGGGGGGTNSNPAVVVDVGLSGVPETAVWVLHNRAATASDPSKDWFRDDKAIEIYSSIDYDHEASFGKPDESTAIRGWLFDQHILEFWKSHPDGTVVNFAEGLETQRFRLEESRPEGTTWITVDLPSTIQARERFILPDKSQKNLHVSASVLDTDEWIKHVPKDKPVFFSAQGLFMYLLEDDVRGLFQTMAKEFPSSVIVFDIIAKWLSDRSMSTDGWKLTERYRTPEMPFGVKKSEAVKLFRAMIPGDGAQVEEVPWPLEKNDGGFFIHYIVPILMRTPIVQNLVPGVVMKIRFPPPASTQQEQ